MKKIITVLLALALVFSLIGCDSMVDVMGKMSKNIAGAETKVVEKSLGAAKAEPSKVKEEGGTKTFSTQDGRAIFTVAPSSADGKVDLVIGDKDSKLKIPVNPADVEDVEAILTPKDLTPVIEGLKSGSKDSIEKALKEPADKESKKAAEGTQQVLKALLNEIMPKKETNESLPPEVVEENEAFNKKLEDTIDSILGKGSEEDLTQGDVVVLTALTNVAMNEKLVDSIMFLTSEEPKLEDYGGNEIEHQEAVDKFNKEKEEVGKEFTQDLVNEALTLVDIVSVVPSDMGSGIADLINTFMSGN